MSTQQPTKKANHKEDWHPADIKAALEKSGWTLRRLSVHHGYNPSLLKSALARPYPNAEKMIATALGLLPETIWPSRYGDDGQSNRKKGPLSRSSDSNTALIKDTPKGTSRQP